MNRNKTINLDAICVYHLIFFGYWKVLFPGVSGYLTWIQTALLLLTAAHILARIPGSISFRVPSGLWVPVAAFLVLAMASFLWSPSARYSVTKEKELAVTAVYLMLIALCMNGFETEAFLRVTVIANTALIVLFCLVNIRSLHLLSLSPMRLGSGGGDNPIWICRFFCETLLARFYYDTVFKKRAGTYQVIYYGFLLLLILKTGSKGPVAGLAAAILLTVLPIRKLLEKKVRRRMGGYFALAAAGAAAVAYLFRSRLRSLFRVNFMFAARKGYRLDMYRETLRTLGVRPVFGRGLGSWPLFYWGTDEAAYPHNILLEAWYECGVIAFLLLTVIFLVILWRIVNTRTQSLKIMGGFYLTAFFFAMFSGSVSGGNRGVFTYALICSYELLAQTAAERKSNGSGISLHADRAYDGGLGRG